MPFTPADDLTFDQLFESRRVDLAIAKRRNKRSVGAAKHVLKFNCSLEDKVRGTG